MDDTKFGDTLKHLEALLGSKLYGPGSLKDEIGDNWQEWVCRPVINHPLAPRHARGILEVFGQLADYGITPLSLLRILIGEVRVKYDPQQGNEIKEAILQLLEPSVERRKNMDNKKENAPKAASQVSVQFGEAADALQNLSARIEDLGERLCDVMREPPTVKESEAKEKEAECLVMTASKLRSIVGAVKNQAQRIADYLDRLEL